MSFFLCSLWHSGKQSPALALQGGDLRGDTEGRPENEVGTAYLGLGFYKTENSL